MFLSLSCTRPVGIQKAWIASGPENCYQQASSICCKNHLSVEWTSWKSEEQMNFSTWFPLPCSSLYCHWRGSGSRQRYQNEYFLWEGTNRYRYRGGALVPETPFFLCVKPSPRGMLLLILGRDGDTHTSVWERNIKCLPLIWAPTRDQTCSLGMCPDQGLNPQFWCRGPRSNLLSHLARARNNFLTDQGFCQDNEPS